MTPKTIEAGIRRSAAEGPVGPMVPALFVDYHLRRAEAALHTLSTVDLDLEQMERLERALVKAHAANQIRVTEWLDTHPEVE